MKKIINKISVLAFVLGLGAVPTFAQTDSVTTQPATEKTIDVTRRPDPLEKREFFFPDYTTNSLESGLKLFFVSDKEQPTLSIRLLIKGGSSQDAGKPGIAEITSDMIFKGTRTRNADSIARLLDGVGASFSTAVTPDYTVISISGLKKHQKLFFNILLDVLTEPTFPDEELDKLKQLYISSAKESQSRGSRLAQMLAAKAVYGETHPYAQVKTVEGIASITKEDIVKYFKKFYMPNNATMALVGDLNNELTTIDLRSSWTAWKRGIAPTINIPAPKPMPYGVYYIPRASSVQSSIAVCSKTVPYSAIGYNELSLGANVIGGGFSGRLFRTLREQYSYTYSPFGQHTQNKFANMFVCGAEVRNTVTDSAIDVTLEQIRNLANTPADTNELNKVKSYYTGKYLMNFENTDFVANLVQNADFLERSMEDVRNYASIIGDMKPSQVTTYASEYMNPNRSYIIVVGVPEVLEKLKKYGKVYEYTEEIAPTYGEYAKYAPVKFDAEELLEKYGSACGSLKKMKRTESLVSDAKFSITINGKTMNGTLVRQHLGNKFYQSLHTDAFEQSIWRDGNQVIYKISGTLSAPDSLEAEKQIYNGTMFPVAKLIDMGYKCKVLGKSANKVVMKAVSPRGTEILYYFDAETFLLLKSEQYDQAQGATAMLEETYLDYREFDGLKLPTKVVLENPFFKQTLEYSYKLNAPVDPAALAMPKE